MSNITATHVFVSGKVQGVFYRDSTRKKAQELDLTGWVKNLPDGRVELYACGSETAVEQLLDWLWEGPPAAEVIGVDATSAPIEEHMDFH